VKDAADSADVSEWKVGAATFNYLKAKLVTPSVATTDIVSGNTSTGLTYSKILFGQSSPGSGQTNPHFDDFPLVITNCEGPKPVSGAANYQLDNVVKLLDYTWNGSSWVDPSRWDTSRYSTAYAALYGLGSINPLARQVIGAFTERTTFTEFLTTMCRSTASRVGILSTGKFFLYPWGYPYTVAAAIPAGDIIPVSWQVDDISTVINQVGLSHGLTPLNSARGFEGAGREGLGTDGYAFAPQFDPSSSSAVELLAEKSQVIWGIRELSDNKFAMRLGGTGALGKNGGVVARYYLSRYRQPLTYATFVVPYHKYKTLELFDTITFSHPEFPSFYGTDPEGQEPVYEDSTTGPTNLIDGYEWVRAETYRGLLEQKTYVLGLDQAPAIRLTVLVLLNYPVDPT
jgi:hypothetical protein